MHPELNLLLVGPDDGFSPEVRGLIELHGLGDRVIMTGIVTGDDLVHLYKNAEVFILPSYHENFGMVVVEAMACGTPVIVSDKVGIQDDIRTHSAGIVVKAEVGEVFDSLMSMLSDGGLKAVCSRNARHLVNRYEFACNAKEMLKNYTSIIESHGVNPDHGGHTRL